MFAFSPGAVFSVFVFAPAFAYLCPAEVASRFFRSQIDIDGVETRFDPQLGEIVFVRNVRSRRLTVRITTDGLRVTLPPTLSVHRAMRLLDKLREGIAGQQRKRKEREAANLLLPGESPALRTRTFDVWVELHAQDRIHFLMQKGTLRIFCPAQEEPGDPALQRRMWAGVDYFLRKEAKRVLPPRLRQLADASGFTFRSVKIRAAKTRWGSCSSAGDINLSFYLLLLPPHLADYVMLHELCHTREMNHGTAFWHLMDSVTQGQAKALRAELRQHAMPCVP